MQDIKINYIRISWLNLVQSKDILNQFIAYNIVANNILRYIV